MSTNQTLHPEPDYLALVGAASEPEPKPEGEIILPTAEEAARLALVNQARAIAEQPLIAAITTHEEYSSVASHLELLNATEKSLIEKLNPWCNELHKQHKAATTMINSAVNPLKEGKRQCSVLLHSYEQEQERLRVEAEAKINQQLQAASQSDSLAIAQEAQIEAAIEAEASGNQALAEEILEQPIQPVPQFTPPIVVPSTLPKIPVSRRGTYKIVVNDLLALVKSVAKGEQPITFLCAAESALNKQASATREHTKIPGCTVQFTPSVQSRGKR